MTVYHRRQHPPFKWVLAGILFLLVLTFTVTEVNGYNHPPKKPDNHRPDLQNQPRHGGNDRYWDHHGGHNGNNGGNHGGGNNGGGDNGGDDGGCNPPTTAVPEPATMILLGAGLGGMVINRMRARKK